MRLLLCDDHLLFIEPLAAVLERHGHEVTVVTAPQDAIRSLRARESDLCLLDLSYPNGKGLDVIHEIHVRHPRVAVVILSGSADPADVAAAFEAGAAGFVRKDQPVSSILEAVRRIGSGRAVALPPSARTGRSPEVTTRRLISELTSREREVLRRLIEAQDTVTIARSLGIAPTTARTHLQNLLLKLGVHSRLQAVSLVLAAGAEDEL